MARLLEGGSGEVEATGKIVAGAGCVEAKRLDDGGLKDSEKDDVGEWVDGVLGDVIWC